MSEFESPSETEFRLRNLEAMMMLMGCELKVQRTLLVSFCRDSDATINGKNVETFYKEMLDQQTNSLLAAMADIDPDKATWFAKYIKDNTGGNFGR